MLNCPRPGSLLVFTFPVPPPPSCSPFSGKSSSNTNTDRFAVRYGEAWVNTVTAIAGVQPPPTAVGVQVAPVVGKVQMVLVPAAFGPQASAGIGLPLMPWPTELAP